VRELFVKICGITNLKDALCSLESGADAVGFIFYDRSPRRVSVQAARQIVEQLPESITKVGVFVNPSARDVSTVYQHVKLTAIQVYGDQSDDELRKLGTSVIKAFRVGQDFDVEQLRKYSVDAFLLDSFVRGQVGGTGETFDWSIAKKAMEHGKVILSGGLKPENVEEAVRFVHPYGVDVCSGVEERPGKKDLKKVRDFIQRAKSSLK